MTKDDTSWRKRARAPLPALVTGRLALFAAFFDVAAILAAFGTIVSDQPGWAKVIAGVLEAVFLLLTIVAVLHLRRPVREPEQVDPIDHELVARWTRELDEIGFVDFTVSDRKASRTLGVTAVVLALTVVGIAFGDLYARIIAVCTLVMVVSAALVPHLEFVTGGSPAIRVDSIGITVARWPRLTIPWSQIREVRSYIGSPTQVSILVVVSAAFFNAAIRTRARIQRPLDHLMRGFAGSAITIPSTAQPAWQTLAYWLNAEAQRRR